MDRANGNCRLMGIVVLLCEPLSVQPATAIVSEIFSYRKPNERQSTHKNLSTLLFAKESVWATASTRRFLRSACVGFKGLCLIGLIKPPDILQTLALLLGVISDRCFHIGEFIKRLC